MNINVESLIRQIGNEFDRLRWSANGEVRLGIYHQATNDELDGFPWEEQATAMETVSHREFVQLRDEDGNTKFRSTPVLDAAGNPIVNSAGDAFDVVLPAHRGLLLYGHHQDVARLRTVTARAGKLLLRAQPKLDERIDFTNWRFASSAGVFWSILFEIAWLKVHPFVSAEKRICIKNCSYPYDVNAIKQMRASQFGGFGESLPEKWETELPDAFVSTIEEGLAASLDVWNALDFGSIAIEQANNGPPPPPAAATSQEVQPKPIISKRFHVAVSFPGAIRVRVKSIIDELEPAVKREKILYDNFHTVELAVNNLDVILPEMYRKDSQLIVVFACAQYLDREWCGLEWRAIRELLKTGHNDYRVLRLKLDDTALPGEYSIDGFISIKEQTDREVADMILQRLFFFLDHPEIQ